MPQPKIKMYLKNSFPAERPCTVYYRLDKPNNPGREETIGHGGTLPPEKPIQFFEDETLFIWAKLNNVVEECGFKIPMKSEQVFSDFPLTIKMDSNNKQWVLKINTCAFSEIMTDPKNVNVNIGDKDQ